VPRCSASTRSTSRCRSTKRFSISGHRKVPRRVPRPASRDCRAPCRSRARQHRVDRIERQQVLCQARLRSRQAAFAALGHSEAGAFLANKPVAMLWGVGAAMQGRLAADGIALIGQPAVLGERKLAACYGRIGARMGRLGRGEGDRLVDAHAPAQTISVETTLAQDEADAATLAHPGGRFAGAYRRA
jgi:hypothetical protein